MAKVFTQEEREKIKGQVVELVRRSGRETLRQLEAKTGATRYLMSVLARELVASGDVYNSGYGLFPSEQARKDWQNARKKLSRAKVKKLSVVDPDLIWSYYGISKRTGKIIVVEFQSPIELFCVECLTNFFGFNYKRSTCCFNDIISKSSLAIFANSSFYRYIIPSPFQYFKEYLIYDLKACFSFICRG